MEPNVPDYISVLFMALTFVLAALMIIGYRAALKKSGIDVTERKKKTRKLTLLIFFWLIFLARISNMHFFHDWSAMPPRIALAGLPPLVFVIYMVASGRMNTVLAIIPQHWLILIQSFRIVMEFILLFLFLDSIIPVQMTFEGKNFDILSGITALIVAHFVYRNKVSNNIIIAWNVFGLLLLLNIFVIAILSTPLPIRVFMNEPANTVVAYFPFVWLPGFVVPVAYTMHFLSIKKCLLDKNKL